MSVTCSRRAPCLSQVFIWPAERGRRSRLKQSQSMDKSRSSTKRDLGLERWRKRWGLCGDAQGHYDVHDHASTTLTAVFSGTDSGPSEAGQWWCMRRRQAKSEDVFELTLSFYPTHMTQFTPQRSQVKFFFFFFFRRRQSSHGRTAACFWLA